MELITLRPKLKGYIGVILFTTAIGIAFLFGGLVGAVTFSSFSSMIYVIGIGVVALGFSIGYPIYLRKTTYTITETEVIKERETALSESHERVPIEKIENTTIKRGLLQRILGTYGTISISTAGGSGLSPELRLYSIEDAKEVHNSLLKITTGDESTTEKSSDALSEAKKLTKATEKLKNNVLND